MTTPVSGEQEPSIFASITNPICSAWNYVSETTYNCFASVSEALGTFAQTVKEMPGISYCAKVYEENSTVANVALGAIAIGGAAYATHAYYGDQIKAMILGDASVSGQNS